MEARHAFCRRRSSLGVSVLHKMAVRAGHSGFLAVLLVCFGEIKQEYESFVSSLFLNKFCCLVTVWYGRNTLLTSILVSMAFINLATASLG